MRLPTRLAALPVLAVFAWPAAAADASPPSGVLNLQSSASAEVAMDLMSITLTTTREGQDAQAVQAQLKQALDAALNEARRVAKPGQIDVRTGNFSLHPRYNNKGQMSGWQGTAELVIEGRDMPGIGQLAGRISTMTVARVGHGLSREAREKSEGAVSAEAIASYRAKAAALSKAFGYTGYTIREVNVMGSEPPGGPVPMLRMQASAKMAEDAALPVEAGKTQVTVTVQGTVQMTR